MEIIVALLAAYFLAPTAMALLVVWVWHLSRPTTHLGVARYGRLAAVGVLAAGLTCALNYWLQLVTEPMPSAHGAGRSIAPWVRQHPALATLLSLTAVAVALGSSPARRGGALSFAAGMVLAGDLFLSPALPDHCTQRLVQARRASRSYEATAWQFVVEDSFLVAVARRGLPHAPAPPLQPPEFPGGAAALTQQLARLVAPAVIPAGHRVGCAATVEVTFILETTGRPTLPHVTSGLGPGYDEAAVDAVTQLPPFRPARRGDGPPVGVVWQVAVPFAD